jgi:catechol 2,3-dioxygenase-like lactoylglutathione lyase family enzyme
MISPWCGCCAVSRGGPHPWFALLLWENLQEESKDPTDWSFWRVPAQRVHGIVPPLRTRVSCQTERPGEMRQWGDRMASVSVRYIVNDVEEAIDFYCNALGFHEEMHPAPSFAMLSRGDLRLVLSVPGAGAGGGQATPDGTLPEPGGWNRFSLEVDDLDDMVQRLRQLGARFRNDVVAGVGGKQILVDDPSGNPVELFEPTIAEARLSPTHPD